MAQQRTTTAIRAYVDYLNTLFNTLITDSRLTALAYGSSNVIDRHRSTGLEPQALELSSGFLHFRQFVTDLDGHIQIESYEYTYSNSGDRDDEDSWICAYHYNRDPDRTDLPRAHVHIYTPEPDNWPLRRSLRRTHFPTLRMSVEHLIWFVIDECRAKTKVRRGRALEKLARSYEGFLERRGKTTTFPKPTAPPPPSSLSPAAASC